MDQRTHEDTGYDTQKPESLLERIIKTSSDENGLVADFFSGSGTTLAVAEKLRRRWIGCDLSRWAIHVTRKRLLGIEDCKPFEILNLGKYERQYWQGVTFGDWAVDWQFQNDTFMQGWVTYRTRKDRKLALSADPHTYDQAGRYRILVKVVDIFGNDTSQVYDVEV